LLLKILTNTSPNLASNTDDKLGRHSGNHFTHTSYTVEVLQCGT